MNQIASLSSGDLASISVADLVRIGREAIERAGSFEELRAIAAKADALQAFQRAIGAATDAVNAAAEIRIRAERRMGEELKKAGLSAGRPNKNPTPEVGLSESPKLADIGVSYKQSSRYQHLADISDDTFDAVVE